MKEEIINKGIPSNLICELYISDLLRYSNDKTNTKYVLNREYERYATNIRTISNDIIGLLDYSLFRNGSKPDLEESNITLAIVTDPKTLKSKITFSPTILNSVLIECLSENNIRNNVENNKKSLNDAISEEIDSLTGIKKEVKFKKKYKNLYSVYESGLQSWQLYKKLKEESKMGPKAKQEEVKIFFEEQKEHIKLLENLTVFKNFQTLTSDILKGYVNNKKRLIDDSLIFEIPIECFKDIEDEKVELYISTLYLMNAEEEEKQRQESLYYVTNYFNENKDRKNDEETKIIISMNQEKGFEITPKKLYARLKDLLVYYPELKFVNLPRESFKGKTLKEVEEFMKKHFEELKLNWEFLSPDEDVITREFTQAKNNLSKEKTQEELIKEQEKLEELYMEKKSLFDSSNPELIIRGKNTFDGYAGYIYSNGKVLLEKFFENQKKTKIAKDSAIYIMDLDNFYELSLKSKRELIENKSCQRIYHSKGWQEKVLDSINSGEEIDINQSIKKIKKYK